MQNIPKNAFQLIRFDSLQESMTKTAGVNLLANASFETGSTSGWNSAAGWTAVASNTVEPTAESNFVLRASSAAKGTRSALQSERVAVSGNATYVFEMIFATPTGAKKRANTLKVQVFWFDAPVGGTTLRTDVLYHSPVKPRKKGFRLLHRKLKSPNGATHARINVANTYGNNDTSAKGILIDDFFFAGQVQTLKSVALDTWHYDSPVFFRALKYSNHWQQGNKMLSFRLHGSPELVWHLLNNGLGQHLECYYDTTRVFAGMLYKMAGQVNGVGYSISLDDMANYIKVPFSGNQYAAVSSPPSMRRFGRKDFVASEQFTNINDARDHAQFLLNDMAFPRPVDMATDEQSPANYLDVQVMGYFTTLDWVTGLQPTYRGDVDLSEAAATYTTGNLGGRSALERVRTDTTNDFISSDYSSVDVMGRVVGAYELDERQTTMQIIQALFARGSGSELGIVGGVDADRRFFMHERPTSIGYRRRRDADGHYSYFDRGGNEVPRPLILPGEFVAVDLPFAELDLTTGLDAAASFANRFLIEGEYDAEANRYLPTFSGDRRLSIDVARIEKLSGAMARARGRK